MEKNFLVHIPILLHRELDQAFQQGSRSFVGKFIRRLNHLSIDNKYQPHILSELLNLLGSSDLQGMDF